jgi:hypothetical protein
MLDTCAFLWLAQGGGELPEAALQGIEWYRSDFLRLVCAHFAHTSIFAEHRGRPGSLMGGVRQAGRPTPVS